MRPAERKPLCDRYDRVTNLPRLFFIVIIVFLLAGIIHGVIPLALTPAGLASLLVVGLVVLLVVQLCLTQHQVPHVVAHLDVSGWDAGFDTPLVCWSVLQRSKGITRSRISSRSRVTTNVPKGREPLKPV